MEKMRQNVEKAQRILIIGGGPTGVEQAGEIAAKWSEKEVTILSGGENLVMDGLSNKFYSRLDQMLTKLNVNVIKGEKLEDLNQIDLESAEPKILTTDKGTSLEVDYVLKCIGLYVDPSPYKEGLGRAVTETGHLRVNEFLEVEGYENIYAIGDCNIRKPNLAYASLEQAELLVKNLYCQTKEKRKAWKDDGLPVKIAMSVGPHQGIGQLTSGRMLPEFVIRAMKSKDLMVGMEWKKAGLPVP